MNDPTLSSSLEEAFLQFKDKPAIKFGKKEFTYADLDRISGDVANKLTSEGLSHGDRIAVRLSRGMAMVFVHLASLRLGIVSLPLNPLYSQKELEYFLSDSQARFLITDEGTQSIIEPFKNGLSSLEGILYVDPSGREWIEQATEIKSFVSPFAVRPDDGALMFYTSGTTGPPKGCIMTQKSCITNLKSIIQSWEITKEDRLMHVLPLNHAHGLYVASDGCLLAGCFILMKERFDAEAVLQEIDDHQLTLFMGVPTHYHRFLQLNEKRRFILKSMRLFISGSAPLSEEIFINFRETFGYTILERYGMTEIGIHISNLLEGKRLPGKVGLPLPGTEARIVDIDTGVILSQGKEGELQVRGPNIFSGYWKKPKETEKSFTSDGWFRTGDIGQVDKNGYYSIVGRVKDLIISGGLNISPLEVEQVINTHHGVLESAVIGVPDKDFGEKVVAYIILKEGCEPSSLKEIQYTCRQHLASYKKPNEIYFVNQLPRNTMGKILKKKLRLDYPKNSKQGK